MGMLPLALALKPGSWLVTLCVGLGGVALLERVCHREHALRFQSLLSFSVLYLCFLFVVQNPDSFEIVYMECGTCVELVFLYFQAW